MRMTRFRLGSLASACTLLVLVLMLSACISGRAPGDAEAPTEEGDVSARLEEGNETAQAAAQTVTAAASPGEAGAPSEEEGAAPGEDATAEGEEMVTVPEGETTATPMTEGTAAVDITTTSVTTATGEGRTTIPVATAEPLTEEEQEVVDALDEWIEAVTTTDPGTVAELYAEDAVLWGTLSPYIRTTPESIQDYFNTFMALDKLQAIYHHPQVRIYGDTAINSGYYTFFYEEDGEMVSLPARYTFVYEREGDSWLIVDHHSSMDPTLAGGE